MAQASRKFLIEDERHAEAQGEYLSLPDALSELRRRAALPWDQAPNVAPCTNWQNCGRSYEIIEYDVSTQPWTELRRFLALEVSAGGVQWANGAERDA
jgi:hypothetical protein